MVIENLVILSGKENNWNITHVAQYEGENSRMGYFTMKWPAGKNGKIMISNHQKERKRERKKERPMTVRFGALHSGILMPQWKMSLLPQQREVLDE